MKEDEETHVRRREESKEERTDNCNRIRYFENFSEMKKHENDLETKNGSHEVERNGEVGKTTKEI